MIVKKKTTAARARELASEFRGLGPTVIAKKLEAEGYKATASQVLAALNTKKLNGKKLKKRGPKPVLTTGIAESGIGSDAAKIIRAVQLLKECGGDIKLAIATLSAVKPFADTL